MLPSDPISSLIDCMEEMVKIDFSKFPQFRFMGELRHELLRRDFSERDAESLVSEMNVVIDPTSPITDAQIYHLASLCAQLIDNQRECLKRVGVTHLLPLAALVRKMELRLKA